MMSRDVLRRAIRELPRYTRADTYRPDGKWAVFNAQRLKSSTEKHIASVARIGDRENAWRTRWVDVSGDNVWTIQRRLRFETLWFLSRDWKFNQWAYWRLPCIIRHAGKIIIWNGTHRTTLSRIAGRRIRAQVLDVDELIARR